jgi:hypothetical protein
MNVLTLGDRKKLARCLLDVDKKNHYSEASLAENL